MDHSVGLMPILCERQRELTTKVHREQVLYLGWGAALLLHVADPHIAQAVADHGVFLRDRGRRVRRLYSTADTMLWLLFGTPDETRRAAQRINRIHDRVHGILTEDHPVFPAGTYYSAHEPALLAWVHVALHTTVLAVYDALLGPLDVNEKDRYCREVAFVEPLLGIPDGILPRDATALRSQFESRLALLSVGRQARRIARGILYPAHPWWTTPLLGMWRLWTVGFLPPSVRVRYDLQWSRPHARAFYLSLLLVRRLLPLLPERLRHIPPEVLNRGRL
jgi:uncharacterized protein (DUF2236 family)